MYRYEYVRIKFLDIPQEFIEEYDFSIEYVGKEHALHLLKTLEMDCEITTDWEGTKISDIDLTWNYHARHANRTCRISMKGYIRESAPQVWKPFPQ